MNKYILINIVNGREESTTVEADEFFSAIKQEKVQCIYRAGECLQFFNFYATKDDRHLGWMEVEI